MNDNWWTMQKLIEGRERELRVRMEQIKPWIRQEAEGGRPRTIRNAIGRALLAWGSAITATDGGTSKGR